MEKISKQIKFKSRKPIIMMLVFLFIFTSQPGILLAAEQAAAPAIPAETPAAPIVDPVNQPTTDPASHPAASAALPADQAIPDQTRQDAELGNNQHEMLLDEEEEDTLPEMEGRKKEFINLSADSASGALNLKFNIKVPPGRNKLQPDLQLIYNNQDNDNLNIFGYGWSINIPYIERLPKKGVNKLYSEIYFTSSLDGELEDIDLSDDTHGTYGAKVENGSFLQYEFNANNYWLVTDKKGTIYKFGYNASARQDDSDDSSRAYKWMLEEVRDTNNNYIKYEYYKDNGQIYPYKIKYTGDDTTDGIFGIEFLRESRTDDLVSYKTGFEVTTNYLIYEIQVKVNSTWARKYELDYAGGDNSVRAVLDSITESGQDEQSNIITLPAHQFTYQTKDKSFTQNNAWSFPEDIDSEGGLTAWQGIRYFDANGDGLIDIVQSYRYFHQNEYIPVFRVYLNNGIDGWDEDEYWDFGDCGIFAETNSLPVTGFIFSDLNGDGYTDVIKSSKAGGGIQYICFNDGNKNFVKSTTWSIPDGIRHGTEGYANDPGIRLEDINGDGLIDVVRGDGYYEIQLVFLNDGESGWTIGDAYTLPADAFFVIPAISPYAYLADINGDGLVDIIKNGSSYYPGNKIYLNNGKDGWEEDSNWNFQMISPGGYRRLLDINGDKILDIVSLECHDTNIYICYHWPETNIAQHIYIGNGKNGWVEDTSWEIPTYLYFSNGQYSDFGVRTFDFNGDGLVDFVRDKSGYSYIPGEPSPVEFFQNDPENPDLLSDIQYSLGLAVQIGYKSSGIFTDSSNNLLNPALPYLLQTVSQITYNDGLDNEWAETYEYADGEYCFEDYLNRKLSGFGKVTKTDGLGNVTKTYFHQGNETDSSHGEYSDDVSKIGKIYRQEINDDSDNLYSKTINKWENYDLGNDRDFVKLTQTIDSAYDGNTSHKDKAETYTYDNANGNLTQKITWGEVTGSDNGTYTDTGADKYNANYEYADAANYISGYQSQETTTDQSDNKVKEIKYYYDGLTLGNVDEGNLTKQEMWTDNANYIDTQKVYNAYGLVTQEIDPRGKTTDYAYDANNLYPATVTNALDQETDYEYDYSSGKVTQITDPNSRVFQMVYDALDRVKQEKQPDLTTPSTLVVKTEYTYTDNTVPSKVQQTNYLDSSTSFDIYTYLDGFGRKIQERKEAEDSNTFSARDFVYNDLGLLEKESLPYFSSGTARTTATSNSDLYTSYTYDPLQRVVTATNVVGTTTNTYDDWKLTITDAENNVKDLYKDAYDNLIQVDEHDNANTYTTNYAYNGLGNLIQITDSQDNVRNFTYDGLGRRLTAEDLHDPEDEYFGDWTFSYDDSGNLTSRTDPKNQTVNWTYDDINRVLTENYTGQSGTEVVYVYDTGTDGIGRLYTATTPDVVTTYTYNALGGIKTENKNIDSEDYLTEFGYDRQGNQTLITYPSEDQAKYEYNTAGLLEKVQGKPAGTQYFGDIVSDYDYSPLEQVSYQENANGDKTFNAYDEQKLYRLKEKITASPDEGDYGEGVFNMAMAGTRASVIQSEAPKGRSEESFTPVSTQILSALGVTQDSPLIPLINQVSMAVASAVVTQSDSEESMNSSSTGFLSALGMTTDALVKPDSKVQRDFLGRPVDYDNYPKDTTVYLKSGKLDKPKALPEEAVKAYNEASKEPKPKQELKTYLPQEAIDYFNKNQGGGESMLLSGNPPDPSTNLESEALWKTENIVYNQGFEDGFNSWSFQNNLNATREEDCTVSYAGECSEKVVVNTTGQYWQAQLYQILKIQEGMNYKLRFKAKASTNTQFSIEVSQHHDQCLNLGLWKYNKDIGTDWQNYEYTFTGLDTDEIAKIALHVGANSATYWFDEVELIPDPLNMLKDTSFEYGMDNWTFFDYLDIATNILDSEASEGDYSNKTENSQGGQYWQVSLSQPVSVVADTTYLLTFYAKSNYDQRLARVAISLNYSPWSEISSTVDFYTNYNGGFVKYQIELTPTTTESNARLIFYLGDEQGWIKLDNLRFWPKQATKVSDSTPEFSAIYDDPDSGDYAEYYQFQIIKYDGTWSNPVWDSGKTEFNENVLEGDRTEDIVYDGPELHLDGMKYFWRIKLWDDEDNEGAWTNGNDFFVMAGKRIQDLSYTYDDVGNIMRIDDESETNTRKTAEYEYDELYRLTTATITDSATEQDYTQNFTYDSIGNITSFPDNGDYEYNGNTGTSFANPHAVTDLPDLYLDVNYDNNGNLVSEIWSPYQWTIFSATWDYNNRLLYTEGLNDPASYIYDHTGQRIKQNIDSGGDMTIYPNKYYNINTQGETSKVTEHVYDNKGSLVLTAENDGTNLTLHYDHTDHLGGTSVMTQDTGEVEQIIDYYPFGGMRFNQKETGFDEQRKHTGHEYDTQSDLTYMGARYYAGVAGKFLSQDPIFLSAEFDLSNPQTLNSYSYVKNNPLRYFDPLGLFEVETGKIEKGDTLSSITPQINKQYGTNLSVKQIAQANNIKDPNKIKTGDYLALPNKTNLELRFDNKNLQAYDTKYNIPYGDLSWGGVSGRQGYDPIPEGTWGADPANTQYWSDISKANKIGSTLSGLTQNLPLIGWKMGAWPGGTYAWGTIRTELSNQASGVQNSGYYIHGGGSPGSAGCIDLTSNNNAFHQWFTGTWGKPINLIVNY